MVTLRPVPDSPPRAVLYLRQSISHDDSISLELQEASCRAYCEAQGYEVVVVESDPGISGRTWKRPAVQRVMDLVESGGADVIVLWKWSRLSRSRRDWAVAADRADVAGGRIESSTEHVDIGTATGRLTRGMLVELAAFESDRIGEVWKEVHTSRLAKGLAPTGARRFGYRMDRDVGLHVVEPGEAGFLVKAYEQYVAGRGFRVIAAWLNAEGSRTTRGGLWTVGVLIDVMDAGFGAGLLKWKGGLHPGAHEAVVGPDLWQAYSDRRAAGRRVPARVKASKYVLSGLVKCARCEGPMVGQSRGPQQSPAFRCKRYSEFGRAAPDGCLGGYVSMRFVEGVVRDELEAFVSDVDHAARRAERTVAAQVSAEGEQRRLVREVGRLDDALSNLTVQLAEGVVPAAAYQSARDDLVGRRTVVADRLEEVAREGRAAAVDRVQVAASLLDTWDHKAVEARRQILGSLLDRVVVQTSSTTTTTGVAGGTSNAIVDVIWRS